MECKDHLCSKYKAFVNKHTGTWVKSCSTFCLQSELSALEMVRELLIFPFNSSEAQGGRATGRSDGEGDVRYGEGAVLVDEVAAGSPKPTLYPLSRPPTC